MKSTYGLALALGSAAALPAAAFGVPAGAVSPGTTSSGASTAVAAAAPTAVLPRHHDTAHCSAYNNDNAYVARSTTVWSHSVKLYYNPNSRCAWAVIEGSANGCPQGQDFGGCRRAAVQRSDGFAFTCSVPAGGTKCATAPIYDGDNPAGGTFTSRAIGYVDAQSGATVGMWGLGVYGYTGYF